MATKNFNAMFIEKLAPPATGQAEYHDTHTPGLVLRVTPHGTKSFSFKYEKHGRSRRYGLGQYPGLTLEQARKRAWDLRAALQRGEDPVESKRIEERDRELNSFRACKSEFIERYAKPKNKTWRHMEQVLDRLALPYFEDRPVKTITRRDCVDLLDKVAAETPYQSRLLQAYLSKLWNWLLEREVVAVNPFHGITPRQRIIARDRILTDEEVAAFWRATQRLGGAFGSACRLLLLTGMRKTEV